ncbi:MAG: hypothetical protein GC181_10040 [Bacteroidetes bacterium]|nr:hypothetical protein [Bacteroidota bacterium]
MTEEYATEIEWTPQWDTGAPMPQVFSNGHRVYLIYRINEYDPDWDGTYVNMVDNTSTTSYPLALVEFAGHTFRFGIANDEVFSGLPLWSKGLSGYAAHIIENSTWITELKNIHRVHPYYEEDRWKDRKHFALLFHDEILEVIATDYTVETFITTFKQLAAEVVIRMNQ